MEMIGRIIEKKRNRPGVTALHFTVTVASLGLRHLSSWPWHPLLFLIPWSDVVQFLERE